MVDGEKETVWRTTEPHVPQARARTGRPSHNRSTSSSPVDEIEAAIKRADDKERLVGLIAAPVAAAIELIVTQARIDNDPPATSGPRADQQGALQPDSLSRGLLRRVHPRLCHPGHGLVAETHLPRDRHGPLWTFHLRPGLLGVRRTLRPRSVPGISSVPTACRQAQGGQSERGGRPTGSPARLGPEQAIHAEGDPARLRLPKPNGKQRRTG